jgi:predicted ribosome quality control (RQC) complex YloA/Tae2 family protein
MLTDHLLFRRAAAELDRKLRGARVRDVGLTDRRAVAIVFGGGRGAQTLEVDPFGSPPLLWVRSGQEPSLEAEPAWLRRAGAVLRGLTLAGVGSRPGDRVVELTFQGRSRFGITDESRLVLELVPRFGNVLLLRGGVVVAAAKTFSPAENPRRSVRVGAVYEPPPAAPGRIPRAVAIALGREADRLGLQGQGRSAWLDAQAASAEAAAARTGPIHVYRRGAQLVQAHVLPLGQYADLEHTTAAELLPVWAEFASQDQAASGRSALDRRRDGLLRGLRRRHAALGDELTRLAARERELGDRDRLRRAGEAIYARLSEIPPSERASAKAEAASYFARYRKAGAALPHLARRRAELEREQAQLETLLWEVERADATALDEIARDLEGAPTRKTSAGRGRLRQPLALDLPSGARVYVGRSPRENAAITFGLARPDDLWFHARNAPGAHVVLVPANRTPPSDADVAAAAALAAYHSRARSSAHVDVDYTRRKYVRRQKDAAPGMVWYTDFKTIRVAPRAPR